MIWDWNFAFEIVPAILQGLRYTLLSTLFGTILALVLGLIFALGKRSHLALVRKPVHGGVEFIRRTPLLVQIYFIFFVLPDLGVLLPALLSGVLALGLHTGAYLSEVYRAGIDAVPRGQWESARALNYPARDLWLRIILPQAIPPMIPAIGNYIILMFKESALLSIIAVPELMTVGRNIGNETYRYLEPLTMVGIAYLALSLPSAWFVRHLERRFSMSRLAG